MNDPTTLHRSGPSSRLARVARRAYAVVLVLTGVALGGGGVPLLSAGGSAWYLGAGIALVVAGVLVWRRQPRAASIYGGLLAVTVAWAVDESGASVWALLARLGLLLALGVPLIFQRVRGPVMPGAPAPRIGGWRALVVSCLLAAAVGSVLHATVVERRADPMTRDRAFVQAPGALARPLATVAGEAWHQYGNDAGGTRFSPIRDLTPANVDQLRLAWSTDVGPVEKRKPTSLQATPIDVGDALYLCSGDDEVLALDAENGRVRWRFTMTRQTPPSGKPCRGVAYAKVPNATGLCAERILAVGQEGDLLALDTATGRLCPDFGSAGRVSLREGLGGRPDRFYYVSSAPQIVRGKAVLGGAVVDGQFWGEPSGVVRAFDVVTGRLAWAFDTGRPGPQGLPPAGQSYTPSSPNSWAPISADESLGLVYLPMGNSVPDFFGGRRRPADEELGSAVVALDAETGAMRWRYQTVHHDLWDYDLPAQPTLVDLPTASGVRKALIQPTKRGEVFVLDRETGVPIKAVQERAVPQPPVAPGERLSPTQPFSVEMPSFRSPRLRESDMWGLTPIDQMVCRLLFVRSRYEGTFTPVGLDRPTLFEPGYSGGHEWGGVSVDIDRGIGIFNWVRLPSRVTLVSRATAKARDFRLYEGQGQGTADQVMENTPYAASTEPFLSPLGVPCTAPPWGMLSAVDLVSGEVIWNQPFGTGRDSGPLGIRSHLPVTMGVPNIGGSVTTRGGLTFIGASADGRFRAFETATGRELWEARLPGGGQANPMTYRSPRSGRQFVVIAAGGKPAMGTRTSTQLVAYALPK